MDKFIITGQKELKGEISVKGAKNLALKIIPAALLSEETLNIANLPRIEDVKLSLEIIQELGGQVEKQKEAASINTKNISRIDLSPALAKKLRASIMFAAPLLARFGEVKFPHPGGCVIGAGSRPIDLFLEGFAKMGAEIDIQQNYYHIKAKKLIGCEYFFTTISVTGTESMIMAAVLAENTTILKNCAMEPEIIALADYLNAQGAIISGAGTPTITIKGVKKISAGNIKIIPDRIEAGTFVIMAAATNSEITITECIPEHFAILLNIFSKIGIKYQKGRNFIKIFKNNGFPSQSIKTHEYPGFPTDLQSPYTLLMTQANGSAIIHETIWDRRLLFTDLLAQMGANIITCDPHRVVVNGPTKLFGKNLTSPDLRAGITMILAGLIAQGKTQIENIYQIDRGYENIDERLKELGADIVRAS
jgi:UDP-N-acetylglucosamine 1-carboxyvinyltransferase